MAENLANPKQESLPVAQMALEYTMIADKKRLVCLLAPSMGLKKVRVKECFENADACETGGAHPTSVSELDVPSLDALRKIIGEIGQMTAALQERAARSEQIEFPSEEENSDPSD